MSQQLRNAGFCKFFPVEGFVDGGNLVKDHVAVARLVFLVHGDRKLSDSVRDYEVSVFHDFDLLMCDSYELVTHQEIGFGSSARSNYRKACGLHAPKGVAAGLPAGVEAACA